MAGENPKTNAAQALKIEKLEMELKVAFKDGKFETVRKKAEDIRKMDPENRLVKRVMEKVEEEETTELKRANAERVRILELKMDQMLRAGDVPGMTRVMDEIKKLDPKNGKVLSVEGTIAKAKLSLEAEMRKEKIRKLTAEVEFFVNKADWAATQSKANELLALEWNHPVAMRAIGKVAKAKRVRQETLITVKEPKVEPKPGFFARLFAKKPESAKPSSAKVPEVSHKEAPKPIAPVSVAKPLVAESAKPVTEVKPVAKPVAMEVKKAEPAKAVPAKVEPKSQKPGFFARLFAKKPESAKPSSAKVPEVSHKEAPKPIAPVSVAKPLVAEAAKPVAEVKPVAKPVVLEVKKAEPAKAIPAFGALASMLDSKPVASRTEAPVPVMPMKSEVSVLKPLVPAVAPKPMVEAKPIAPVTAPVAKKPSIFGSLFAKKEEPKIVSAATVPVPMAKPVMATGQAAKAAEAPAQPLIQVSPKPMVSVVAPVEPKQVVSAPSVQKAQETQLKVEQKAVAKPDTNVLEKGNIFTSLFGKGEEVEPTQKPSASVLETIVAKTAPAKAEAKKEKVPEERTGEGLLSFASVFLKFAIVFILVSAAFLYVENMDTGNNILGLIKKDNNAIQLHNADQSVMAKKADLDKVNKEIGKFKGGYTDENQKSIEKIVANRMDWPTILGKLNEVTESVYAKNAISQYVQYNNYSYDTGKGQLTVSGTLSDPLGKNLTKLAELEQAFRNYPRDPSNPNDDRKPYFFGLAQFNTYAKNLNSVTGRFQSTFNLALSTKEPNSNKKK